MTFVKLATATALTLGLLASTACKPEYTRTHEPTITNAWARTTPQGAVTGAGYLLITAGSADRLIGASSPAAEKVEVHESMMEGMVMTMKPIEPVDLGAGETLTLAPGGKHLMFVGLKGPFTSGASVPVTLRFETAGEKTVELVVRNAAPEAHPHAH